MSIEQFQNFMTLPEFPDVILMFLYLVMLISIIFIKAFVKKDNKITLINVNKKTSDLDKVKLEFEKEKAMLQKERKQMRKEIKTLKETIKQISCNSPDLVSNGTANFVVKTLVEETQVDEEGKDE